MDIFKDETSKISLWIITNRWTYSLDVEAGRALSLKGNILPLPKISLWIIANRWKYSLDVEAGRALNRKGNILPLPKSFIIDLCYQR